MLLAYAHLPMPMALRRAPLYSFPEREAAANASLSGFPANRRGADNVPRTPEATMIDGIHALLYST